MQKKSVRLADLNFFIHTFGCQMNESDSEHLAGLLRDSGASKVNRAEEADLILVNTCAVRKKSEEKLFSYLGRLSSLKKKKPVIIGVLGCVAQVYKDRIFDRNRGIDFVVGPGEYHEFLSIVENFSQEKRVFTRQFTEWHEFSSLPLLEEGTPSAYVTIMEGCDNFCSYCIVPFSRGRERSRPSSLILREVKLLAEKGIKEIQLLGQNVNSYKDPESGYGLDYLLDKISEIEKVAWIRFLTSHPWNFDISLINAIERNPKVCRQVHLPLQSGSNAVLQRMKRSYTRESYLELICSLKSRFPEICVSTDIIVGFPGETETDFEDTCRLLRQVKFSTIFSFRYSPRPYSAASRLKDDVPLATKQSRLTTVQSLQKEIQIELNRSFIDRKLKVLGSGKSVKGDGQFSGRSQGNLVVNFQADFNPTGKFVMVRITDAGPYSLRGVAIDIID